MGIDEEATLRALTQRRAVMDGLIVRHRGRIVSTAGDSVLAEFASVVDAVRCAVEVQEAIEAANAGEPDERRMRFRIGVNLGDVLVKDGNLFGDGVNVAARLEALAEPGGICVSATVRDHVGTKLAVAFADMGEQTIKNIAQPVRAWRVGAATGAAILAGNPAALALPDKPSIAVLAFANMSGDPEQEFLADGIAEDIITALSRIHAFFVIARNSSFTYKGKAVDVKRIGRELGVRYLVEGSVQKSGNRIRITAQLIDATTSAHLWAERFDRDLADIFAVQDEITDRVAASIEPQLFLAEDRRARGKPPASLDAWDCVMRSYVHLSHMTAEDCRTALDLAERAIDLDSSYSRAFAQLAWVKSRLSLLGLGDEHTPLAARDAALKAVALDHDDPWGHFALGLASQNLRQYDGAIAALGRTIELNPNFALAHAHFGYALATTGRSEEAIARIDRAVRMNPRDPHRFIFFMFYAFAHFAAGRHEEALNWSRKTIHERPDYLPGHRMLVVNSALAGDIEGARAALNVLKRHQPGVSVAWAEKNLPFDGVLLARLSSGLRLAGLE